METAGLVQMLFVGYDLLKFEGHAKANVIVFVVGPGQFRQFLWEFRNSRQFNVYFGVSGTWQFTLEGADAIKDQFEACINAQKEAPR